MSRVQIKNEVVVFLPKLGLILSIAINLIFSVLIILAHVFAIPSESAIQYNFPEVYNWKTLELSELVFYGEVSKILFTTALIINGIFLLLPLLGLSLFFKNRFLRRFHVTLSIVDSLALIAIGIFSEDLIFSTLAEVTT